MPSSTLRETALSVMKTHHRDLITVGDAPWELVGPAILKLQSPEQLDTLQENSPQIISHTPELWSLFIKRDIAHGMAKLQAFSDIQPHQWSRLYWKLRRQQARNEKESANSLKRKLAEIQENKPFKEGSEVKKALSHGATHAAKRFQRSPASYRPTEKGFFGKLKSESGRKAILPVRTTRAAPTKVLKAPIGMLENAREEKRRREAVQINSRRVAVAKQSGPLFAPQNRVVKKVPPAKTRMSPAKIELTEKFLEDDDDDLF